MLFESALGESLLKNDGTEIQTSELSTSKGGVIGLYFSGHWCPPCREFTPKLATEYKKLKEAGKDFEVVFVSLDKCEGEFTKYHGEQPWFALPFGSEKKNSLKER